jgi:hypothetical protein
MSTIKGNREATDNTARNERIRALVKEGHSYSRVVTMLRDEYPSLSREAISGIMLRDRQRAAKLAKEPLRPHPPLKRQLQSRGVDHEARKALRAPSQPPKPIAPPRVPLEPLSRYERPLPDGRSGVPFMERTGCAWPSGDSRKDGLTFCNAPCCEVVKHTEAGKVVVGVRYCAEHWNARRASANTKVLA